jgi:hypothetical protein
MAVVLGEEAAVKVETKKAGKPAKAVEDARRVGPLQERRHGGQALLVPIQVEAGVSIREMSRFLTHAEASLWRGRRR